MIQPRRSLTTGAILLVLVISHPIPGRALVQPKSTTNTIAPPTIIKSDHRSQKLPDVKFETKEDHYTTYFTTRGMILAGFTPHAGPSVIEPPRYFELQILLRNAQTNVEITTLNPRLARSDFFGSTSPSWLTNIPNYAMVKYSNLYPAVDMLSQVHQGQLDLNFVIAPGGDPKRIRFQVEGAQAVRLTPEGTLLLNVQDVTFELPKPEGYQAFDESSARAVVDARYVITGKK